MMPDGRDVVCSEGLLCCDSEPGFGRIAGIDSFVLSRVGEVKETRLERKMRREKKSGEVVRGREGEIRRDSRKRIIRNGGEEERNGEKAGGSIEWRGLSESETKVKKKKKKKKNKKKKKKNLKCKSLIICVVWGSKIGAAKREVKNKIK
jgi:hypothetical protein